MMSPLKFQLTSQHWALEARPSRVSAMRQPRRKTTGVDEKPNGKIYEDDDPYSDMMNI